MPPISAPPPDATLVPEGFLVGDEIRVHFLDWDGPTGSGPAVVLVPGLMSPAWSWAPVARRLAGLRRTIVADLRGHGLSDSPIDGYDIEMLATDIVLVAEAGLPGFSGPSEGGLVVAGHGFGGCVAAVAAARMGDRCAGVVLVDGGFERLEVTTGLDVDEFLRGLDEPPEVMRSMDAWLADRRAFDPGTWDADQARAAADSVVETGAGHVVRAVRPHVVEAVVRTMFDYDPAPRLASIPCPVTAMVALASGDAELRLAELGRAAVARTAAGRSPVKVASEAGAAHNLPRYRPAEVAAAILAAHVR